MRKLFALLIILSVSFSLYSKDYISDKQFFILKDSEEKQEANHGTRLISFDDENSKASIQVLSGKTITRNIRFVDEKSVEQGKEYGGYYSTTQGEKIFVGEDEIVFEANRTLGAVFIYNLEK